VINPLELLDTLSAASNTVRSAEPSSSANHPAVQGREAAKAHYEPWMGGGWGLAAWTLAFLAFILLLTMYVGTGVAMVVGIGATIGVTVLLPQGVHACLPPAAARQWVSARSHEPGDERTGDAAADAFLGRLSSMTPAEWSRVPLCSLSFAASARRDRAMRRAFARVLALVEARGAQAECDAIARGVRAALARDEVLAAADLWGGAFARMAAAALLLRRELSPGDLRALYSPFEPVIPLASLLAAPAIGGAEGETRARIGAGE
jgi:hypothetical protein